MSTAASYRRVAVLAGAGCLVAAFSVSEAFDFTAERREEGVYRVAKSVENFRDGPDGRRLGTLLEGTGIERISQSGNWVRFRVEGWVWGPSLDGFEEEKPEPEPGNAAGASERLPLQENLPRLKRLVNDTYGVFYGVNLDEIASRLVVRLRVRNLDREELHNRQLALQQEVLGILEGELEFASVRIETNRPEGSGQVGTEIAETAVEDIAEARRGQPGPWRQLTRFSSDGGQTWYEGGSDLSAGGAEVEEGGEGQ